jgi:16S rRNA processing protein RimM
LSPDPVVLGRITGLFGVRGWVKVFSYTDPREAVLNYDRWLLSRTGDSRSARVAEGKRHGKTVIVRLEGYDDRDQAAALIGFDIGVPRDELPDIDEGRYYWSDLEGLQVVTQTGKLVGTLDHFIETGANDVMVIKGDQECLIPFVMDQVVVNVDLAEGVITVDWDWD